MSLSNCPTLVVIGSGPGIGVSTATVFGQKKFDKIALLSRNAQRLEQDKKTILDALRPTGRTVEIRTWSVDITKTAEFQKVLTEVGEFGEVSCVHFNAARVEPSALLEFDEKEILYDFMVSRSKYAWHPPC
jgi:short-subunit dehydrogenase